MVIARTRGGIGNQLFIYAAARRLALKNSVPLKLDIISGHRRDWAKERYRLDNFNIKAEIASEYESYESLAGRIRRNVDRTISKYLPFEKRKYITKVSKHFDERLSNLKVNGKLYLDGYWFSEKYFKDIESTIREDLKIVTKHDPENEELARRISSCNSVSLHARRLRGVGNIKGGKPKDSVLSLPIDFYPAAIKEIAHKVPNPHFFCFSDFPGWLEKNLSTDYPITFITHNFEEGEDPGAKSYEDLWLTSQCKHHIIANSTFSWWGAWLNPRKDKIVLAPRQGLGELTDPSWKTADWLPDTWNVL